MTSPEYSASERMRAEYFSVRAVFSAAMQSVWPLWVWTTWEGLFYHFKSLFRLLFYIRSHVRWSLLHYFPILGLLGLFLSLWPKSDLFFFNSIFATETPSIEWNYWLHSQQLANSTARCVVFVLIFPNFWLRSHGELSWESFKWN